MIYSDKPCSHLYLWNNQEEVKRFLELCCFRPYHLHRFHARFVPDPDRNVSACYIDDELDDGTQDFFPQDVLQIAVHNPNPYYMDDEEPAQYGEEGVRASEIELDSEFWHMFSFPYIGYIWFDECADRCGNSVIEIPYIQPLNKVGTVHELESALESESSKRKVENLKMYESLSKERRNQNV